MANAAVELPDDVETLKAMVLTARAETAAVAAEAAVLRAAAIDAEIRIERLHALLKMLERARYAIGDARSRSARVRLRRDPDRPRRDRGEARRDGADASDTCATAAQEAAGPS